MGHRTDNGLTLEELITTTTPAPNGCANSKYLAEHLLAQAAKQSSLHASFARVGQIAGPVRSPSLWNKAEWFPSLVLSSLHVGALPDTLGPALDHIDWVPVGLLAEVLVDLALNKNKTANESVDVFHPVNLYPLIWEVIRPIVEDALLKTSGEKLKSFPSGSGSGASGRISRQPVLVVRLLAMRSCRRSGGEMQGDETAGFSENIRRYS
ncbi:hypothetical protein BDV41DRAFT_585194 [Aspergillus transmontanensis]|uniref:Thioester reductase (TE) domain-containing protein n=1 Tax=Aspergillus transmontanensis TaxID=1034304 RepID=A0A5N6VE66_9EURO|nr:hypothetical protein BDV41DRAFT_585194 [Aspergillus transmontanensis]